MQKTQDVAYFKQVYGEAVEQITKTLRQVPPLVAPTFKNDDPLRLEAQRFILEGGKRFRPALSYVVAKTYGTSDVWPHLALEAFHKYILAHDDIIDRDDMRYGAPTVHAKMSQNAVTKVGDKTHYGNSLAIVAGDLIEAATYKIILNSDVADDKKVALCKLVPDAMDEVGWGWYDQFLMDYEPIDSQKLTQKRVEDSIIWVTGKYTIKLPFLFGLTLASQKTPKQLDDFVAAAGLLFQTGDDLMGLFGKVEDTGKSNFGDIAQGKKTLPMWLAYSGADQKGKELLKKYVGSKEITAEQADQVREVIKRSGALEKSQQLMAGYRDDCLRMVEEMEVPQDLKRFLRGFVHYIETRDR